MEPSVSNLQSLDEVDNTSSSSRPNKLVFGLVSLPPRYPLILDIVDYETVQLHSIQVANILLSHHKRQFVLSRGSQQEAYCMHPHEANRLRYSHEPRPYVVVYKADDDERRMLLLTIRAELPPTPLPEVFLQIKQYSYVQARRLEMDGSSSTFVPKSALGALMWQVFQTGTPLTPEHPPVTLAEIMPETSRYLYPTDTQLVDLMRRIVRNIESLPSVVFYYVTPRHILITNPQVMGKHDHPQLDYRLCPFALGMDNALEMPICSNRQDSIFRSLSLLPLYMATRLTDLTHPNLYTIVQQAIHRYPGLMSIFEELWPQSNPQIWSSVISPLEGLDGYHEHLKSHDSKLICHMKRLMHNEACDIELVPMGQKLALERLKASVDRRESRLDLSLQPDILNALRTASPSLRALLLLPTNERTKHAWDIQHIGGLMLLLSAMDMRELCIPAIEAIWHLIVHLPKSKLGMLVGPLSEVPWLLIPKGKTELTEPASSSASSSWIKCMNSLEQVLFELSRAPEHCIRLRRAQQLLLENGITSRLGGSVIGGNRRFSYKVLMPICRLSVMMSLHFPTMEIRLIFDRNVRKMSEMIIEAAHSSRGDIHPLDRDRFIGMMLIMSNFGSWMNMSLKTDAQLMNIWDILSDETFMLYVLPCSHSGTDNATLAHVARRLEHIFTSTCKAHAHLSSQITSDIRARNAALSKLHQKLSMIGEWMVSLAWNANEQVRAYSWGGTLSSMAAATFFKKMRHGIMLRRIDTGEDEVYSVHDSDLILTAHSNSTSPVRQDEIEQDSVDATLISQSHNNLKTLYRLLSSTISPAAVESTPKNARRSNLFADPTDHAAPERTSSSDTVCTIQGDSKSVTHATIVHQIGANSSDDYSIPSATRVPVATEDISGLYAPPPATQSCTARDSVKYETNVANETCFQPPMIVERTRQYPSTLLLKSLHCHILQVGNLIHDFGPWYMHCNSLSMNLDSIPIGSSQSAMLSSDSALYRPSPGGYGAPRDAAEVFFVIPQTRINVDIENHMPSNTQDGRIAPPPNGDMHFPSTLEPMYDSLRTKLNPFLAPLESSPCVAGEDVRSHLPSAAQLSPGLAGLTNLGNDFVQDVAANDRQVAHLPVACLLSDSTHTIGRNGFDPITMRTNIPICRTYSKSKSAGLTIGDKQPGTTGMMQVRVIDSGDTNGIIIGIGWDVVSARKQSYGGVANIIPGLTANSLGFQVSTGHVLYQSEGKLVRCPISPPCGTKSVISIAISQRSVYMIIDDVPTPVIPNFLLPGRTSVYGLVRVECAGIKISSKFMTKRWDDSELPGNGRMMDSVNNPLAYQLYKGRLRSLVCPHWHASIKPTSSRPRVQDQELEASTKSLPSDVQEMIRRVKLSHAPCSQEQCIAPLELQFSYRHILGTMKSVIK